MLDIDEIRQKVRALEDGKPRKTKWKPTEEHLVRALPIPGEDDLGYVIKWHYGVDNGRQMYCPGTDGDDCPFCTLAQFLRSWKDTDGRDKSESVRKRDWELFKKVDAAVKHYVPVVVRKDGKADEFEGPFLWEMTPKTYTALFKVCANDERNEDHPDGGGLRILTSLTHGVDILVTLKKSGQKGNQTSFDLTEVEPRMKMTAVIKGDERASRALLDRIPNLESIGKRVTTEEAQRVFDKWEGSMDRPADASGGSEIEHGERAATGGSSVDETVAKLSALISKKD